MKYLLNIQVKFLLLVSIVLVLGLSERAIAASPTGPIGLATTPLATSTNSLVDPNVLLVLDNSGSMDWDHMPDDADDGGSAVPFQFGYFGGRSSQCNQVYFDPTLTYTPPLKADGTYYADSTFTSAKVNGFDTSGSPATTNLNNNFKALTTSSSMQVDTTGQSAYYYQYSGSQTTQLQKNYNNTANTFYAECSANNTMSGSPASGVGGFFSKRRLATTITTPFVVNTAAGIAAPTATITVSGTSTSTIVSSVTVNGTTITIGASTAASTDGSVATNLKNKIGLSGYTATVSSNVITITGPAGAAGFTPVVNKSSGNGTFTNGTFSGSTVSLTVNGVALMSSPAIVVNSNTAATAANIAANITLNGFSATVSGSVVTITGPVSAINYQPIASFAGGGGLTFDTDVFPNITPANLTNFANWYTYYRTRLLMMKTAAGTAFNTLDKNYRVGLMKISVTGTPTVPVGAFEGAQRSDWYTKLYATTTSGSTPLRTALSEAGRYYAGKLGGTDPLQYSCQQNFSILSTDGYWNSGDGYKVDGSTAVGNQDGTADRPMNDGFVADNIVTTTYTRNQYSSATSGCSGGKKKLVTQAQTQSCAVVSGVAQPCTAWANSGGATASGCLTTVTLPSPNPTAASTVGSPVSSGGSPGTSDNLADVAMYYYKTDLRPGSANNDDCVLCKDNVFISGLDNNKEQHMTTFTLGLGASGWMNYTSGYVGGTNADFNAVDNNATATATICTWQTIGTKCNWPEPGMDGGGNGFIANIDDLWHAAVNGRGAYFSATNPETLAYGLSNALAGLNTRKGAAAAAATSTLNPVAGNNYAFVASYSTVSWKGNLEARKINTQTGVVNEDAEFAVENVTKTKCDLPSVVVTNAASGNTVVTTCETSGVTTCPGGKFVGSVCVVPIAVERTGTLQSRVANTTDSRLIWTKGTGEASLNNFNLTADGGVVNAANFSSTVLAGLTQWPTLDASQKAAATTKIVKFLRGQKGNELAAASPADQLFRDREAVLGDTLESQPAYVAKPTFNYLDAGYSAFKTTLSTGATKRPGTVYIGANDGMMHAFAENMEERWAYVPSMVIPNMWQLADSNYAANHANYVNGSPVISDVYYGGAWHTILVGGLNEGGRGYYALEITDPTAPKLLWEFTTTNDSDLGYSYGNPIITKKSNGDWVVLVTSGYNNVSPGNGKGYLYVIDPKDGPAATGLKAMKKIATNVTGTVPSGLAQISAWADDAEKNNTTTFVYGGDLLGNLWRFDINAGTADPFAVLTDTSGSTQPITTKPELGRVLTSDGKVRRVVFIGTGSYLGTGDLADTQKQTLYAIKDDDVLGGSITPVLTNRTGLIEQKITKSGATRTATNNKVDFKTDRGWYVDFPEAGERQNVAAQLVLGSLIVPTTIPSNTACEPGGTSWLNYFNYKTGSSVRADGVVSTSVSAPIVGVNIIYITDPITGKIVPKTAIVTGDNPTPTLVPAVSFSPSNSGFQKKRAIWRELITQ